jgi:ketosteroid isomerase-like protein
MDAGLLARARAGLEAWQRGDASALEPLLDPDAELLWWKPGDWDCHGRDAVVSLLRERASRRAHRAAVELIEAGDQVLVVSRVEVVRKGSEAGRRPATVVSFRNDKIVTMRQFRSLEEALAAARS